MTLAARSEPPTPHRARENASGAEVLSRRGRKQGVSCVTFGAVAKAIGPHDVERAAVLSGFRARGGSPDAWHLRLTREAMRDALVAAEDAAEYESHGRMTLARASMRRVRRRLELELEETP